MSERQNPRSVTEPDPAPPTRLAAARAAWRRLRRMRPAELLLVELSIPAGSALFMAAFLISAALGVVRQVLLNAQFGAGSDVSAFYAAFRLPDTLGTLIAGGALSGAMIPVLLRARRAEGAQAEQRLASLVLTTLLAVVLPLTLASMLVAPVFVRALLAPGFDAATSQLTATLTRLMLAHLPLSVTVTVAMAVLHSRNRFVPTALALAGHNATLIVGIGAAALWPGLGVYGPTAGVLLDAAIQAAILLPILRHAGFRLRPAWSPRDRRLREVLALLVPNGLSLAINYAGTIVDTAFASLAREPGALPAVHNAFLLTGLPIRLLGHAVGQSAFPRLAAHAAAQEWGALRRTLLRALGVTCGLTLPAAAALVLLGRPLIRALFEHGRFDAAAGALTYAALVAYIVALPAYIATEILTRGLLALYDTRTPLLTNLLQIAGRVALVWATLDRLGVLAIPVAFAATSALETLALGAVLWVKLRRRMRG